jgi:hypothetical protein
MSETKKEIKKTSATIFESQLDVIKTLPKSQQLEVIYALFDYEMYGIEPKSALFSKNKIIQTFWIMTKPLIDKRLKWVENGRKGGRPKKNENQTETKSKPNHNQTKTKRKADKEKDMELDKEMEYPSPNGEEITEPSHTPLEGGARSDNESEEVLLPHIGTVDELPVDEDGNWIWPEDDY